MRASFPARMKFQSKMKALEWSQYFSYCKSFVIFSDAQEKLTPQSMVGSGRISISSETEFIIVTVTCKSEDDPNKKEGRYVRCW